LLRRLARAAPEFSRRTPIAPTFCATPIAYTNNFYL
jgi:hypothetical protein